MSKMWLVAVAAAVLVSGAACNRNDKTEQAAALESAYQAGIITKGEYDAKKAALVAATAAATTTAPVAPASPAPAVPVPTAPVPVAANPAPAVPPAAAPAQVAPPAPGGGTSAPGGPGLVAAGKSTVEHAATRVIAEPKAALRAATPDQPAPLAGCEDAAHQSGKESGTEERFFAVPEARVKEAAASALQSLDFTIHKNSRNTLEANKKVRVGPIAGPGGERVTLEFRETERDGQPGTLVTGETKKNFVLRVGQKSWTDAVLAQTGCILSKGTARP